ncbi:MAG: LysE family transporter [Psychrobacter sp.]|nr:LysE family transporter [Psychrobacter sp.]
MTFWHGFMVITTVHLLAAASPGPDFVLVSQQTLSKGRRTGLLCSLGITLGLAVHIIYSVLGLATIIAHSQPLLTAIKWLGGGYLMYLGWQGIRAKPKVLTDSEAIISPAAVANLSATPTLLPLPSSESAAKTLRRGFFCNVFNPKAPIYFVAIFTLVLSPTMPTWQLAIYGTWMMVLQVAWFSTVVMLLSIPTIQRRFARVEHWIDRVLGAAMIGLGLNLILRSR